MHIADFLSRPCSFNLGDREIKQSMISDDLMYGVQEDKLLDTLQTDSIAIKMRGIVRNKWLKTNEGMGEEMKRLFVVRDSITCYSDFI